MQYSLLAFLLCLVSFHAQAKTIKNIAYVENTINKKQQLDLYLPENAKNVPVHIFVHGGGWNIGDKKSVKAKEAKAYTDHGIILVTLNYRLSPDVQHPAHMQDIAAGVSWVYHNISKYGGNPENMILSGHSAGGHLVALLGTDTQYLNKHALSPNIFKSIVSIDHSKYDLTEPHKGPLVRLVKKWTKNAFGTDLETLKTASPFYQDLKDLPPFLILVSAERNHAVKHSKIFTEKLRQAGQKVELIPIKNRNHIQMKKDLFKAKSEIFRALTSRFN